MVWWNIFEYHTKGMLNDSEFAELMDTIYYFRQNKDKYRSLTLSPKVELVWQALKEVIAKSEANHRSYEKSKEKDDELEGHSFGDPTIIDPNDL